MTWWQFILSTIGASLVTAVALVAQGALADRRERRRVAELLKGSRFEELRGVHLEMINALVEVWRSCDKPARSIASAPETPANLAPEHHIQMPDSSRMDAAYSALLVFAPREQVDVAGEAMRWTGRLAEALVESCHPTAVHPRTSHVQEISRKASEARREYADLVHGEVGPSGRALSQPTPPASTRR